MKIYFKSPSGAEFSYSREPLESGRFYALVLLSAYALFLAMMLLWEVWR